MKALPKRMIRRRKKAPADGAFFKKEGQEPGFFSEAAHDTFFQPSAAAVQRKCADCEKEEKAQRMPDKKEEDKKLHKKGEEKKEEDKKLHKKGDDKKEEDKKLQRQEAVSGAKAANTSSYINTLSGSGNPLPNSAQQFFGERMGYDFSGVRVHNDRDAVESAQEMNAKAYAIDNHIVFSEGQYDTESYSGKKLLAHELTHIMQQDAQNTISRKEGEAVEEEPACTAGSVDLEANTAAGYAKGAGTVAKENKTKSKGCPDCEDECVSVTGSLSVPYKVTTNITLPTVPANLTPCQQDRVRTAINGPLLVHERQHVKAFETFNGTPSLPINYQGCEGGYNSHLEAMTETEFERRKASADAKSAALDPFSVPVDLCCKDKEVPKK
jgi:hypothetical protein